VHRTRLGPPHRTPTIVLHGGGPGCHAAADFGALLALRPDRAWLAVDLPGYGGSPGLDLPRYSGPAAALDALLDDEGVSRPVDVLAQSLGGAVALALAARRPERVRRIVLIGSTPTAFPGVRIAADLGVRLRDALYADPGPASMRALMAGAEWYTATPPDDLVDARLRAATATDPAAPGAAEDLGSLLGSVTAPVLAVWGAHDPFSGPDYGAALAAALPRGDLAVLGGTAHHPQSERPAAVAALTDAFLQEFP
jgi:pimeloyl-ACP methyl ester carboxylesterase